MLFIGKRTDKGKPFEKVGRKALESKSVKLFAADKTVSYQSQVIYNIATYFSNEK